MKILHLIGSMNPVDGGPVEGVMNSCLFLEKHGHECHVVCLDDPASRWIIDSKIVVFALGAERNVVPDYLNKTIVFRYGFNLKLILWLRAHYRRYDAIIINGLWNFISLAARIVLSNGPVPYYVYPHGMLDPWFIQVDPIKGVVKKILWKFSEGVLLNKARFVFFTSKEEQELAKISFNPYRCAEKVVGYGSNDPPKKTVHQIQKFKDATGIGERKFFLYLSRLHPKKGCDLLIEAFSRIALIHPDIDLVMAGPDSVGWMKDLKKQAEDLGLSTRIHWPGMLHGDVKWGAFASAEAFVLPSHQENFGVVVAEAMACAKPVLITKKVNIWSEVVASNAGFAEEDTVEGVHTMLDTFLKLSDADVHRMGSAARNHFLQNYEMNIVTEKMLAALSV